MSNIEGLQSRIMAALDQIGQGIDGLNAGDGDTDTLRKELADEKLANAQLEERVKALKTKLDAAEAAQAETGSAAEERSAGLRKLDSELQALRLANKHLRENNDALRAANTEGVVEPHLINKAMMAELEGLRAVRASDRAEMDAVLAELDALVASAGDGSKMEDV
ncbi:hypothetical protein KUD11_10365 [Roseovarius sp. LXJ103]|uniref:hypothetical protein n=1 Tax=Roseovarius carneus TaxID=2853164 RepID=UPI000D61F702|nr:hypothetical protein [Roseovarius carneus]MBZ8119050.1 hypothetical protein [Roseovarius carneus]PWE35302.1 hypothetical protein DD563_04595 [Pelagicola sp. LXJ1103]